MSEESKTPDEITPDREPVPAPDDVWISTHPNIRQTPEVNLLFQALAGAQKKFGIVERIRRATIETKRGSYMYSYADLSDCFRETLPVLNDHGIAVTQFSIPQSGDDGTVVVVTRLSHESGQWVESDASFDLSSGRVTDKGAVITETGG